MAKSKEVVWWSLFAVGGVVAALLIPALIFITGLALPFAQEGQFPGVSQMKSGPIVNLAHTLLGRVVLFMAISLPLFHCVHRIRHTLKDLGLHGAQGLVAFLCYGSAIAGSVLAGWLVCTL